MSHVAKVIVAMAGWAVAGSAAAIPMTLTHSVNVDTVLNTLQGVTWTHDFSSDPAFASLDNITGATLTVALYDESDYELKFSWRTGFTSVLDTDDSVIEFGLGIAESGDFAIGEVDTGNYTYNLSGLSSLYDGLFSVKVISLLGDFGVGTSTLSIDYDATAVPEPGTLTLLGLGVGMLGFAAARRRSRSAR